MAYLFNSVDEAEGGTAGKQNIFGGQQTDQGATSGGAGEAAVQKSSATFGGGGGGGGTAAAPSAQAKQPVSAGYNPAAASSAYKSAAQNMNMPAKALSQAEGSLKAGEQSLQNKANEYAGGYQQAAKGYQLDEGTLAGATGGKDADYQKTAQRLQQADPSQAYKGFEGLGAEQPNIQNVRDPASLYRAESGPNYSAGQSRFDAAMLRRNPEFVRQQQDLLAREKSLKEANTKAIEEQTKGARDYLGAEYGKATEDIRGRLGKSAEGIVTAAKGKETAEEQRRAGLDAGAIGGAQQEKIKAQIKEDLARADPRSEQARSLKYLSDQYDLGNFANVDKDVDWREFIGAPEAEQYNRVQGLLGQGEMLTPTTGGPGAESNFNEGGAYQEILNQMRGKRQEADIAGKGKLSELEKSVQGRVGQKQADIMAEYKKLQPELARMQASQTGAVNKLADFQAPEMDWKSVLTPDEISQYNETATDIGMDPYANTSTSPYSGIKSLQDQLAAWQATQNKLPAATPEIPGIETISSRAEIKKADTDTGKETKNPVQLTTKEKAKPANSKQVKTKFSSER